MMMVAVLNEEEESSWVLDEMEFVVCIIPKDQNMWSLKGLVRVFGYGGGGERKKKMKKV